jgi:phage host-nuclease inhibitor protein Gam
MLLRTAYINCVKSAQNFRGAASSTEKYIKTIGEYNKQLDSNVEELKTKIVELQKRVDEDSQTSTDKLTELKQVLYKW